MSNYKTLTSYTVTAYTRLYIVVIERLRNTPAGSPRFRTTIVYTKREQGKEYTCAKRKDYTGWYMSEEDLAKVAVANLIDNL